MKDIYRFLAIIILMGLCVGFAFVDCVVPVKFVVCGIFAVLATGITCTLGED